MEKITKKKKTKKGLKKRIGLIAIGGLSLVLTICLSVGATLAWFAGSTWSSNQLYMGGPVYVEMAGRGAAGGTKGDGSATANWIGGAGNLDIKAATTRTTGTVNGTKAEDMTNQVDRPAGGIPNNILLPGQKFEIYSQARVFSTAYTTSVGTNNTTSSSSGANVTNTEKDGTAHITDKGRVTSTTTSVLRARFSISIDFDPSVGFNNFTDESYSKNYPQQSKAYSGSYAETEGEAQIGGSLAWSDALGKTAFKCKTLGEGENVGKQTYPANSRRDAVATGTWTADTTTKETLEKIKTGELKSIYKWKFVSASVYESASDNEADKAKLMKMGYPFNGQDKSTNSQGYYGCWILTGADTGNSKAESDAFYKARCNSYIDSYVEEYITEYGDTKTRTIGDSIKALENSLNQSFVQLVNDSSDNIIKGNVFGMTVNNGQMTYASAPAGTYTAGTTNASWLYIDPTIGNDTNTSEISTSTGGWWYLVSCDAGGVKAGINKVNTVTDSAKPTSDTADANGYLTYNTTENAPQDGEAFTRYAKVGEAETGLRSTDDARLDAKLFEINPLIARESVTKNGENDVTKVVSYSFPFVNGTSALPADALTNVFANAKITFQISFQAIQAFFPYSTNIDKMDYTNPLLGTAKALSIRNAIPIYNEAFDYQEDVGVSSIVGL